MRKIKLTQGKYTIVDDNDFERLNQWKWCYLNNPNGYAIRAIYPNKHQKIIWIMYLRELHCSVRFFWDLLLSCPQSANH